MDFKFLPIGTVCLVNGANKKQLIIGYLKGGYDYVAVEYPKGFESDTKLSYFNHSQVKELYSLGYKNEESRIFNGILMGAQTEDEIEQIPMVEGIFEKEKPFVKSKLEPKKLPKTENASNDNRKIAVALGLKFDRNGIAHFENKEEKESLSVIDGLKFKEADVNADEEVEKTSIPVHDELKEDVIAEQWKEEESTSVNKIRFGKDGMIMTEEKEMDEPTPFHKLRFSKDGMLISSKSEEDDSLPNPHKMRFSKDGMVIIDSPQEKTLGSISKLRFSKDGRLIPEENLEIENSDNVISSSNEKEDSDASLDHELSMDDYVVGEFDSENESLPIDDENINVSDIVKRIAELEENLDEDSDTENSTKAEKKGLFHFGKK